MVEYKKVYRITIAECDYMMVLYKGEWTMKMIIPIGGCFGLNVEKKIGLFFFTLTGIHDYVIRTKSWHGI